MRLGRFSGARLRDARLARSMTASMLAERVGVSPGAISHYELRNGEPRSSTLARMSEVLELPQAYFLRPPLLRDGAPLLYRSRSAATKRARESAEARHAWLREIADVVESDIELPTPKIPVPDIRTPFAAITNEQIEGIAADVRAEWNLGAGPIPNVVGLLELMGCVVAAFAFGADKLSAFSQAADDRPYVLLNSDEASGVRWRFNAAHELGHLLMHRDVPAEVAARPEMHKLMENQAHRFAAAFLLPADTFADEVYSVTLDALVEFKSRWRVAIQTAMRRARDLELISQDRYERAVRDLSRRGFRKREPLDDELPFERPQVLSRSIQMMVDEGVVTREDLLHRLPYSPTDLEVLTGLPIGYLESSTWGRVAHLKVREQDSPRTQHGAKEGQVLEFKPKST